jgi:hypothetical protein
MALHGMKWNEAHFVHWRFIEDAAAQEGRVTTAITEAQATH